MADREAPIRTQLRDGVLVITLDRPRARNAIDEALSVGLSDALDRLERYPALRVGVITGDAGVFSAGMDLKAFVRHGAPRTFIEVLQRSFTKPLIAAVEGYALGGGLELALACDVIVAARDALLGLPEVQVGVIAAGGALQRLPHHVPRGLAMELALTGKPITASEAYEWGLVTRLAEPTEALATALELATVIAGNAPLAVAATKRLLASAPEHTADGFRRFQAPIVAEVFGSCDGREGVRSFVEGRRPRWSGR